MRLCTFRDSAGTRLGRVEGDAVVPLAGADVSAALGGAVPAADGDPRPLAGVELASPLVPGKIIGIGLNYRDHAAETGAPLPTRPLLFAKLPTSVAGPGDAIVVPAYTDELDYEGELAVVIGKRGSHIPEAEAMSFVAGYSCYNDFTVRDWQRHSSQWIPGKNFPGTGAFGPCLITADEIDDVASLKLETRVNGEIRQSASVADLIFSIPSLISYVSRFTPLSPGDVLVTGTPGGVGMFREPPTFLEPGDVVEVEIHGVGLLRNVVASA